MGKSSARILKGGDVKFEGTFCLDAGRPVSALKGKSDASNPVQACIVENQPQFAVIEVTCSCGMKTRVKCEYLNNPAAEQVK